MSRSHQESNEILVQFFRHWLTAAFTDIQIFHRETVQYIAETLSRFTRTEKMHYIKRRPELNLKSVVDMLLEAECSSVPSEPEFDPFGERDIRKNVADYTLFMTGIFREHVEFLGIMDFYLQEGSKSYRQVYEFDKNLCQPQAGVFQQLHYKFEEYSGGINYMKKVYFDAKMPVGMPPELIRSFYPD